MKARPAIVADLARHLSEDVAQTINRHARVAEAGGISVVEMSGIMMTVAESVAIHAIGTVLLCADDWRRDALLDETVEQLGWAITRKRERIMVGVAAAERIARG